MSSGIADASDSFGSGVVCCACTAAAHGSPSSLELYSICTPQAAALSQNTRKAVVQQTFSRIFFFSSNRN